MLDLRVFDMSWHWHRVLLVLLVMNLFGSDEWVVLRWSFVDHFAPVSMTLLFTTEVSVSVLATSVSVSILTSIFTMYAMFFTSVFMSVVIL